MTDDPISRRDLADDAGHDPSSDADAGRGPSVATGADGPEPDCPCAGGAPRQPSIFADDRAQLYRRDVAKVLATVGGLTALGSLAVPLAGLTRVFERSYSGPIYGDGVGLVDENGDPVGEETLSVGEHTTVFPEPRPGIADAPTLLVRFEEDQFGGDTRMEFTVSGYAAYSKVCTHAGCMVSDRDDTVLVCPCHSGKFDPLSGASVVGGPPPRRLPQLPITLSSDGALIATGDFEGAVGPGGE